MLAIALGAGAIGFSPATAVADSACPPTWLGTTTNEQAQTSDTGFWTVFTGSGPDPAVGESRIFLRALNGGTTTTVSDPDQVRQNFRPSISSGGLRVSYLSKDLDDDGPEAELWVYDRNTGTRTQEGTASTEYPVVLDSLARNVLLARPDGGDPDHLSIYLRNLATDVETLISADVDGQVSNGSSTDPAMNSTAQTVFFRSTSTDLVEGGSSGGLFVRDVRTGKTTRMPDRPGATSAPDTAVLVPTGSHVVYADADGLWRYDTFTGQTVAVPGGGSAASVRVVDVRTGVQQVMLRTADGLVIRTPGFYGEPLEERLVEGSAGSTDGGSPGAMSANGEWVVFSSSATDLDPQHAAEGSTNVYLRNTSIEYTRLISSSDAGEECEPTPSE